MQIYLEPEMPPEILGCLLVGKLMVGLFAEPLVFDPATMVEVAYLVFGDNYEEDMQPQRLNPLSLVACES